MLGFALWSLEFAPQTLNPKPSLSLLKPATDALRAQATLDSAHLTPAVLLNPKGPCTQIVYTLPQSTFLGTTLRPKSILFGYMDPEGHIVEGFRTIAIMRCKG